MSKTLGVDQMVAVCDVLAIRALEVIGKRIVNEERSRHRKLGGKPLWYAHTLWKPTPDQVTRSLSRHWQQMPEALEVHGRYPLNCSQMVGIVKNYVMDTATSGRVHNPEALRYRLVQSHIGASLVGSSTGGEERGSY